MTRAFLLLSIAFMWITTAARADPVLLMAEENGCYWCARWNAEIGHIYPKSAEGKTAPLQRYDLHTQTPDVTLERRVHYTPTFILIKNGTEVGRIEGYPGEDFFWGMLAMMFDEADIDVQPPEPKS